MSDVPQTPKCTTAVVLNRQIVTVYFGVGKETAPDRKAFCEVNEEWKGS